MIAWQGRLWVIVGQQGVRWLQICAWHDRSYIAWIPLLAHGLTVKLSPCPCSHSSLAGQIAQTCLCGGIPNAIATHSGLPQDVSASYLYVCYSRISNLWLVCKPFNRIVSWLARFKSGRVYMKSKSRSISWYVRWKSGPWHVVDGLPPCACACSNKQSFKCANKSSARKKLQNTIWERG